MDFLEQMTEKELLNELDRLDKGKLQVDELVSYDGDDRMVTSHELKRILDAKGTYNPFLTGFHRLDDITEGVYPGEVIVVSGPTGQGKTTLCQAFTREMCTSDVRVAWFSYEVSYGDMFRRFGDDLPLFSVPLKTIGSKIEWLKLRIRESKAKYSTNVVFIDHLHYLLDMNNLAKAKSTSILIGMLMRELKEFAVEQDIVIFLISHIKKTLLDEEPTIEDLRDSSFIGQESDIVLMVWRLKDKNNPNIYKSESMLRVEKNRRTGKAGVVKLAFGKDGLYEMEDQRVLN